MIVLVAAVAGVGASVAPERGVVEDEVALPTDAARQEAGARGGEPAAASSPFVASPSATVLCSDLSELRVKYAWLGDADVGDTVDVHGSTCIVSAIDLDARRQPYPRGVARGSRPGTGPVPRR